MRITFHNVAEMDVSVFIIDALNDYLAHYKMCFTGKITIDEDTNDG